MTSESKKSRILGAMLGLACGDALGAPAEFKSQKEVRARWGRLTEMTGGGPWERGEWTDDTSMTLAVAEGILAAPHDPVTEVGARFLRWYQGRPKDVGSTIRAALSAYDGDWVKTAQSTPQAKQGTAAGNGSLMRTLPVALAYPDQQTMLRQSARISAMTHWDAQAEVCCAVYCLWVRAILNGLTPAEAWPHACDAARQGAEQWSADTPGPSPLPPPFWERLQRAPGLSEGALQPSGYAGYAVECLEAAVWCVLHGDSLEDVLVRTVNLAGEADTMAAVAGGAAGAYWGVSAIPARWLSVLHQRTYLEEMAEKLADLRRHQEVYETDMLAGKPFAYGRVADNLWIGRQPLTAVDVSALATQSVTHVLDLRELHEWMTPGRFGQEAVDAMSSRGLIRRHLPLRDVSAPTAEDFESASAFLSEWTADPSAVVYVHCRAGRERTACIVTAWYARTHQLTFDAALARLSHANSNFAPLESQRQAARRWLREAT